jgi:hypothetical protein
VKAVEFCKKKKTNNGHVFLVADVIYLHFAGNGAGHASPLIPVVNSTL